MKDWRVLIVDDERDVHTVTELALKRRRWKRRGFALQSAMSGAEAKAVLSSGGPFDLAVIDVVMETDHAGLDLCQYVRETQPRSTRIVLRTGQPGVAPETRVLDEYDIDYYLSKAEITPERFFAVVRAGVRLSSEIATVIALDAQVQQQMRLIQEETSLDDLVRAFEPALSFLESKHDVGIALFAELAQGQRSECTGARLRELVKDDELRALRTKAEKASGAQATARDGEQTADAVFQPITFAQPSTDGEARSGWTPTGCVVVKLAGPAAEYAIAPIASDLALFADSWRVAYQLLSTQTALTGLS